MIALCIECSNQRGMGHLYRALNVATFLRSQDRSFVFMANDDPNCRRVLVERDIFYRAVDLRDLRSNWETKAIREFGIELWINDRLDTSEAHGRHVKGNAVRLLTFDDRGGGAVFADFHVAALVFAGRDQLRGHRVLTGVEYLVLAEEVRAARRQRHRSERLLVTMGGSDTYGVTVELVKMLKSLGRTATVHTGPAFTHRQELADILAPGFDVADGVESLPGFMRDFDVAITGGGITQFEAAASGLPCLTISCEVHEEEACVYLDDMGVTSYLGGRRDLSSTSLADALDRLDPVRMSSRGMEVIPTDGLRRIMEVVEAT